MRPHSAAGTFFIAYARDLSVTEGMLERMFVADADGVYDHLLDFARPDRAGRRAPSRASNNAYLARYSEAL